MVHCFSGGKRSLGVIFGFFDGSYDGKEPATVIAVCGLVAPEYVWRDMDQKWNTILHDPKLPTRLKRFHAYDCVCGIKEFETWGFAERLGLWGDLVGVLTQSDLVAVNAVMICEHFYALDEAIKKRMSGPYHLLVEAVMQFGIGIAQNEGPDEKIGFVFDVENKPVADESYHRYSLYMNDPKWRSNLAGAAQFSSYDATPLQAADLLAYGTFRLYKEQFYPDTPKTDFPLGPAFTRLVRNIENTGGLYEASALKKIVDQIREREGI
jgi:hypothetical protein